MQNAKEEPLIFLEDIYITGLCASNCSNNNVKKIDSDAFITKVKKYGFDKLTPETVALIHNGGAQRFNKANYWYQQILQQRQREKLLAHNANGTICCGSGNRTRSQPMKMTRK